MGSKISWLDHSEDDQRRIREVLQLFSDSGTVDDLGLGTIRDAFSNLIFPGTSVIQTRARYYLFLPWTYSHFEKKAPNRLVAKGADFERAFIDALRQGGDLRGIIGINAGRNVKTLPSTIYWNGMVRYGIFTTSGLSLANYGRRVARGATPPEVEEELASRGATFWNRDIPDPPSGFHKLEPIDFRLSREEAEWLTERITSTDDQGQHASLLAIALSALRRGEDAPTADHLWEIPLPTSAPSRMVELVHHAERFSCAAKGAALLYNLMLAERRDRSDDERDVTTPTYYDDEIHDWASWASDVDLRSWAATTPRMWELLTTSRVRLPLGTRAFVDAWAARIATIDPFDLGTDESSRKLIVDRELSHKRGQARFANAKRINQWEGLAGTTAMAYRWPQVRGILSDLSDGLREGTKEPADVVA